MQNFRIYLFITIFLANSCTAWREVSKCTKIQTDPFGNQPPDSTPIQPNNLQLNCGADLISIAWSHYGNRPAKQQPHPKFLNSILNKPEQEKTCYFSPKDCMVNVDYVANECNGMSTCTISLDSQYLHSCKSYSDYVFIIYECIPAASTLNMCDPHTHLDSHNLTGTPFLYINSPNYPIEYSNNQDCKCSIQTSGHPQIELLEFDLESSSVDYPVISELEPTCTKDYLMIGNETKICSTLAPFTNIIQSRSTNKTKTQDNIVSFKFVSDDALTRRGFWIKVSPSQMINCPKDFTLIDNTCIRVYNKLLTWYEAQNYCTSLGYSLAMIDSFELDKQLNNVLFNRDETLAVSPDLKNGKQNHFWTGIKHLNETNWFDYKNEPIRFRADEKNWWPWLVVDSETYSQGSCVAKRANWLFVEDCYKRMPFACQYKQALGLKSQKPSRIQVKCGPGSETYFQALQTTTVPTTTEETNLLYDLATVTDSSFSKSEKIQTNDDVKILQNVASNDESIVFKQAQDMNKSGPIDSADSSVLIALVCSITILIAFINTIVILFICKRRKLLNQQNQHDNSDKSSKTSRETINSSSNNINFDDIPNTNSSSSLTFNPNSSLFFSIDTNQLNKNHTLFFTHHNPLTASRIQTGGLANSFSTLNPIKKQSQKTSGKQSHQRGNNQDPLSHIYETISVASASNSNLNGKSHMNLNQAVNHYNLLNYYHMHQNQQMNNYNDLECDYDPNVNYNDLSMTDSSGSHKSHDYFIDPRKSLKLKKQHQQHQPPNWQIQRQQNQRFSELNLSTTNTSQSPSSTTTTITDYTPHQFSSEQTSKSQFLINQATLAHFNSNVSAFTKLNSQQTGHSSFKVGQSSVPFNFLSNQVEAVV